jgi:hypothetical protein
MSNPKLTRIEKVSRLAGGGRLTPKNPMSAKEQAKGPRKTSYKGKI